MSRVLLHTHGDIERALFDRGVRLLCGVDEAGRGPLAGPVVAAAVILPQDCVLPGIADSKVLSEREREIRAREIRSAATSWAVARVEAEHIDRINILQATLLAMRCAVEQLSPQPAHVLIDGNRGMEMGIPFDTVVKGDARCFSIAAASILAKQERDAIMRGLHEQWPEYGFAAHKGYGTAAHVEAIRRHGYCPAHRRSFTVSSLTQQQGMFDEQSGFGEVRGRPRGSVSG